MKTKEGLMSVVMREPGSATFWTVEVKFREKPRGTAWRWFIAGDFQIAKVPEKLRRRDHKEVEPFYEFGACGEVWQKTGNHGFTKFKMAEEMGHLIAQHNPDMLVRVVQLAVSCKVVREYRFDRTAEAA
jgi:hypothetical protein